MSNDGRRAYIYAKATRESYVELPEDDSEFGRGDMVGCLRLCLYDTSDAALSWQGTWGSYLIDIGFKRGTGLPSLLSTLSRTYEHWSRQW